MGLFLHRWMDKIESERDTLSIYLYYVFNIWCCGCRCYCVHKCYYWCCCSCCCCFRWLVYIFLRIVLRSIAVTPYHHHNPYHTIPYHTVPYRVCMCVIVSQKDIGPFGTPCVYVYFIYLAVLCICQKHNNKKWHFSYLFRWWWTKRFITYCIVAASVLWPLSITY